MFFNNKLLIVKINVIYIAENKIDNILYIFLFLAFINGLFIVSADENKIKDIKDIIQEII